MTPGPFNLLTPTDGATLDYTRPIPLSWEESVGAAAYRLDVATDPAFASIVFTTNALTEATIPARTLAKGTPHYWRVEASADGDTRYGTGAAGTYSRFTTAATGGGWVHSRSRSLARARPFS